MLHHPDMICRFTVDRSEQMRRESDWYHRSLEAGKSLDGQQHDRSVAHKHIGLYRRISFRLRLRWLAGPGTA